MYNARNGNHQSGEGERRRSCDVTGVPIAVTATASIAVTAAASIAVKAAASIAVTAAASIAVTVAAVSWLCVLSQFLAQEPSASGFFRLKFVGRTSAIP